MKIQKKRLADRILERLQTFTESLEKNEALSGKFTIRKIELDLQRSRYNPRLVKTTRKLLNASQTVFAGFLGVSVRAVRSWEQGDSTPSDIACRFMDEIRRNPGYWLRRLEDSIVVR